MVAIPAVYNSLWSAIKHGRPNSWDVALPWYLKARLISFFGLESKIVTNDFLINHLTDDGFKVNSLVPMFLDGGVSETMVKSVGLGIISLADELKRLNPDIVFVNADRFEMMALAITASYLNIPIVHNEAGDVSGTIDESIRHAITKLAHIHFTSTETSRRRVIQMGENSKFVFNVGAPAIDSVKSLDLGKSLGWESKLGGRFILVLLHPVATMSQADNISMVEKLMETLNRVNINTIWIGSNVDAGSGVISKTMKEWRQRGIFPKNVVFEKNLNPDDFYHVLAKSVCAVGNSSSFIREAAYFGVPVVLVGSRQLGRERAGNTLEVPAETEALVRAVNMQLQVGRYPRSYLFGEGNTGDKIAAILAEVKPVIQKNFVDLL